VDKGAALLVPDRRFDAWSYALVVEVLDGMSSCVWPRCQRVFDDVGPHDGRFEDPSVGEVPA
jgi:hypothetical protein